jgi:hypothetical protein
VKKYLLGFFNQPFGGHRMKQGFSCRNAPDVTSGAAGGRAPSAFSRSENEPERRRTLRPLLFAAVLMFVVSSGAPAAAQVGSTNRDSPLRITSRSVTATVSRPLGDGEEVFYSIAARKGYMTIDFSALARDGMNIVLGVEGSGVFESIGPLISGADDKMDGTVRFKVPSRQRLLVNVRYSGNARYTIDFSGSALTSPGR